MAGNVDSAIDDLGYVDRFQIEARGAGEIEEARDQRIEAIHLGGNVSGKFSGGGLRRAEFLTEHFRRAFDDAQRIADFVSESSGELAERGEAFGAAGFGLSALKLAVRIGERFRKRLIASDLAAIFNDEAIDQDGGQEEEENANAQQAIALAGYVIFGASRD